MFFRFSSTIVIYFLTTVHSADLDHLVTIPSDSQVKDFISSSFDYVIIGGGTAGIALGTRLAEDPDITIGIIEAGLYHKDDPMIDIPGYVGRIYGNSSYDWNFVSTPQVHAGGRELALPRGKILGGSSGINGMAWNRASSHEYDAWNKISSDCGWNWEGLVPFFKRAESLILDHGPLYPGITSEQANEALLDVPLYHGLSGPVSVSHNTFYFNVVSLFVRALNALGIQTNAEPEAGETTGVYNTLATVDRITGTRSYSAPAYLHQKPAPKNLHILTGAYATRILFNSAAPIRTATGVQFAVNSQLYSLNASKEVILSAGAIQSPQLLELSGIGNSTLLKSLGIHPLVELPYVGENLQEHLFVPVQWQLKPGYSTFDILRNNLSFSAEQMGLYNSNRTGLWTQLDSTVAFLSLGSIIEKERLYSLLDIFDREAQQAPPLSLKRLQFSLQRAWAQDNNVPFLEIVQWSKGFLNPAANQSYIVAVGGISHPTSRGSVHITTNDPFAPPEIDPKFLSQDFDIMVLLDVLKFMQKIGYQHPLANAIEVQTNPVPDTKSDDDLIEYIRTVSAGGDHFVGTAAMAPQEYGGVVDPTLKVYGTANVRVVDASIIPLHIAANTQATVYAIAEKAADMMRNGN